MNDTSPKVTENVYLAKFLPKLVKNGAVHIRLSDGVYRVLSAQAMDSYGIVLRLQRGRETSSLAVNSDQLVIALS